MLKTKLSSRNSAQALKVYVNAIFTYPLQSNILTTDRTAKSPEIYANDNGKLSDESSSIQCRKGKSF
jgi:hypothetical protein